jgi:D-alanine transaminase
VSLVYLNGDYVAQSSATIPVTDRGLLFADSTYEVIPVYGGEIFSVKPHLQRLQRNLDAIQIPNPLIEAEWLAIFKHLVQQTPDRDQSIYVQITRGDYPQRIHHPPEQIKPNVIVFTAEINPVSPLITEQGLHAITLTDKRWHRCDIKSTNLLANIQALAEAKEYGADDVIFIRDGLAKEGSSSNLFIVLQDLLITPPNDETVLPGITRSLVLELAATTHQPHAEQNISVNDLQQASEIWLTSSTREIVPVTRLNNHPVGDGKPGSHWQRMHQLYQTLKPTPSRFLTCW